MSVGKKISVSLLGGFTALALLAASPASGSSAAMMLQASCGEPPVKQPAVPDGEKAEIADIREARNAVIAYSDRVDEYIECMDKRFAKLSSYMTKDARQRWAEDIAEIANDRTALQVKINEAIRAYRRRRSDTDGDG